MGAKRKFLIELGSGVDMHGGDMTKAAQRALRDAISHCSMAGLSDLAGVQSYLKDITLHVVLAAPKPQELNLEEALQALPPYEKIDATVEQGGLWLPNESLTEGKSDPIAVVNAAITVLVE